MFTMCTAAMCSLDGWTASSVTLSWSAVSSVVSSYMISYGDVKQNVSRTVDRLDIQNLMAETQYQFIISVDTGGSFSCAGATCK